VINQSRENKIAVNIPEITANNRTREKLTLQQMGDALGVTKQAVGQWEDGISLPDGIFLCAVAMKCKGWRRDWAWACLEAHPRYITYACPEDTHDTAAPAGTA